MRRIHDERTHPPAYRVRAEFVPYAAAQSVPVPMTHIESRTVMSSTGDVVFRLHGTQLRLRSFVDGDQLFIMFRDRTNGRGTYGAGDFWSRRCRRAVPPRSTSTSPSIPSAR